MLQRETEGISTIKSEQITAVRVVVVFFCFFFLVLTGFGESRLKHCSTSWVFDNCFGIIC